MDEDIIQQLHLDTMCVTSELNTLHIELEQQLAIYRETTKYIDTFTTHTMSKEELLSTYNLVGSGTLTEEEFLATLDTSEEGVLEGIRDVIKRILKAILKFLKTVLQYNKYLIDIVKKLQKDQVFTSNSSKNAALFNTCMVPFYKREGFNKALNTISSFNLRTDIKTSPDFEHSIGIAMVEAFSFFDWNISQDSAIFNDTRELRDMSIADLGWDIHDMPATMEDIISFFATYEMDNKRVVKFYKNHIKKNMNPTEIGIIQAKLLNVQKLLPIIEAVATKVTIGIGQIGKDVRKNSK